MHQILIRKCQTQNLLIRNQDLRYQFKRQTSVYRNIINWNLRRPVVSRKPLNQLTSYVIVMSCVLNPTIMRHSTLPTDLAIVPPGCSSPITSSSLLRFAIISNKRAIQMDYLYISKILVPKHSIDIILSISFTFCSTVLIWLK